MGYKALLFCPDEKTARTVTQVLSELEFSVESCTEPFAAVKKLMSDHFDAIVVDCDNEQNATLLFKSARNSTSNQASLAVAVVEGQAGVAKAFRIGANLVLTKPINVEQAKGTLRVARGLLRKGEPAKPAASAPTPAVSPAKPVSSAPVLPAKPIAPVAPAAVSNPLPAAPPVAKPAPSPARHVPAAAASSAPTANPQDDDLLDINSDEPASAPAQPAASKAAVLSSPKLPTPAASETKPAFSAAPASPLGPFGGGAASAPAPAREAQTAHVAEVPPSKPSDAAEALFEKPAEEAQSSSPAPTFTFGGANVPAETGGGSKKILLVAAAVIVVAGGIYGAVTFFGGHDKPVATAVSTPVPAASQPAPKPSAQPASSVPASSASSPSSQPASQLATQPIPTAATPATKATNEESDSDSSPSPAKSTGSSSTKAKPEETPRIVKGGAAPQIKKVAVADAAAPSMIGIATPAAGGPPPNLVGGETNAFPPRLQTLNVSQGVSQGLLTKKVNPTYPRTALNMRIEGTVQLMATISKNGDISTVKVLSGDAQLTKAATDAVKQWKYKPYLLNGEPVEIQTQVTINFQLPH